MLKFPTWKYSTLVLLFSAYFHVTCSDPPSPKPSACAANSSKPVAGSKSMVLHTITNKLHYRIEASDKVTNQMKTARPTPRRGSLGELWPPPLDLSTHPHASYLLHR